MDDSTRNNGQPPNRDADYTYRPFYRDDPPARRDDGAIDAPFTVAPTPEGRADAAAPAPPPAPPAGAPAVPGRPASVRIDVADFAYAPSRATARVGDTVTWTNVGQAPHTVTPSGGAFGTPMLAAGAAYRWVPSRTGTWSYVCAFHPQMTGTLVVLPASAAPPRAGTAAAPAVAKPVATSPAPAATATAAPAPDVAGAVTPPAAPRARSLRPVAETSPLVAWSLWSALGLAVFLALAWWRGREVAEARG